MTAGDPNPNMRVNDGTGQVHWVNNQYPMGWQCPTCGRVYNPSNIFCLACNFRIEAEEQHKRDEDEQL